MKAVYVLTFLTDIGAQAEYEIPRANTALTEEQIVTNMAAMVMNGNFATAEGIAKQAFKAELVETTETDMSFN